MFEFFFIYNPVLGINNGKVMVYRIRAAGNLSTFLISGKLGFSTEDNFKNSKLTSKATFDHVHSGKIAGVLASMQAVYQRQMFELLNIDLRSQAAYDLACKGVIKPERNDVPMVYSLKCIEFKRPNFTIEAHLINANEDYLCDLIAKIGMEVRSAAHCTAIRHTKFGHFDVNDALLRGQWNLQNVFTNMAHCRAKFYAHSEMLSDESATPIMNLEEDEEKETTTETVENKV